MTRIQTTLVIAALALVTVALARLCLLPLPHERAENLPVDGQFEAVAADERARIMLEREAEADDR